MKITRQPHILTENQAILQVAKTKEYSCAEAVLSGAHNRLWNPLLSLGFSFCALPAASCSDHPLQLLWAPPRDSGLADLRTMHSHSPCPIFTVNLQIVRDFWQFSWGPFFCVSRSSAGDPSFICLGPPVGDLSLWCWTVYITTVVVKV